jgi:cell division protein FtsN
VEREKLEIMKLNAKETQNHLQKQMYQQKLLQQQQKIQQEKQQHKFATPTSSSQISKASKPSVFELLNSDDSTDDESNPSKKRPPPPEWSNSKFFPFPQ